MINCSRNERLWQKREQRKLFSLVEIFLGLMKDTTLQIQKVK
jgi:hypothetical protein